MNDVSKAEYEDSDTKKHNALLIASAGYRDFVESKYALYGGDIKLAGHLLFIVEEATEYATWSIDDYKTAYDQYME